MRGQRGSTAGLRVIADLERDAVIDMICVTPDKARAAAEAVVSRGPRSMMCSTVDVYTTPAERYPIDETRPRDLLAAFTHAHDKACAENILIEASDAGALQLTILRPAATYDAGIVAPTGTSSVYLERLRRGDEHILHGDGSSISLATHCDDVARAFLGALARPETAGRTYNVVGGFRYTIPWSEGTRGLRDLRQPTDPELDDPIDRLLAEWAAVVGRLQVS